MRRLRDKRSGFLRSLHFSRDVFRKLFGLPFAAAILIAITVLRFAGEYLRIGDFLSHFLPYWAVLALGFSVCAAFAKRGILCAAGVILFLIHATPVAVLWLPNYPRSVVSAKNAEMSIVSANLYAGNRKKPGALAKLAELSPDVLVLLEIGNEWRPALAPLLQKYSHSLGTNGPTWMLSRYPLRMTGSTQLPAIENAGSSSMLEATVVLPNSASRVVAIHALRPGSREGIAQQRRQAADYTQALQRDKDAPNQVLIGDFNTTPFSAVFDHIHRTTGLRNSSRGWGYHPTWGPRLPHEPMLPWLGIALDHALVSNSVVVASRQVGEMPGSDHRFQMVRLRF